MSAPHNPPAFPVNTDDNMEPHGGMTMRDYFAAKAMVNEWNREVRNAPEGHWPSMSDAAENAYKLADAMLAKRSRTKSGDTP